MQVLDDDVRSVLCPDKISTERWLEVRGIWDRVCVRGGRETGRERVGERERGRDWLAGWLTSSQRSCVDLLRA